MKSFDMIDDPWLDVLLTDGNSATLSLRDVLLRLRSISGFAESSPLTEVSLLRFLIALMSDGLRDFVPAEDEWQPFVECSREGLPAEAVDEILKPLASAPDVLAEDHTAFFDGPAVRKVAGWDQPNARQPTSCFLPELPTRTNPAHFSHANDDEAVLCVGCLLKSRVVEAAFARGGLGPSLSRNLLATISGSEPKYVVFRAGRLLDTILLNLIVGDPSRPSWISIHSSQRGTPGPLARMTWRPRLMFPLESSRSDQPCLRCATTDRPRFAQAVMVDTYNYQGSPFGSKTDVEKWKAEPGDPHLLPVEKNALSFGLNDREWPLRALARMLGATRPAMADIFLKRRELLGTPVSIQVTSSAGNQMKIDDAPSRELRVPAPLLNLPPTDRERVSEALVTLFHKDHRKIRKQLIPDRVPALLHSLGSAPDPDESATQWLASQARGGVQSEMNSAAENEDSQPSAGEPDPLLEPARRIIRRLQGLPDGELAALRPRNRGGAVNVAARQSAFEHVWRGLDWSRGAKRHAVREAIRTVAAIFAIHSECHRFSREPRSFEEHLRRRIAASTEPGSLHRLLRETVDSSPAARDELLLRLVDGLVTGASNRRNRAMDFADLLIGVIRWNDPTDPTPARWRRLLNGDRRERSAG